MESDNFEYLVSVVRSAFSFLFRIIYCYVEVFFISRSKVDVIILLRIIYI